MTTKLIAINTLMNAEKASSRIYNVTSFNPSAKEFFELIKKDYPKSTLTYNINDVRQKIVDSWPSNIDDSLARKDWGWMPKYDLNKTIDYLKG